MPFTISHAAAVLPFARLFQRERVFSAMVIGSMAPDFGYFFPWHLARWETHSALALVTFGLPIGLAAYWVFQHLIKTAVREVLPDGPYVRSRPYAAVAQIGSLRQWLLAGGAVLVGALTHLIWDAFTHEGARGVRMIPALDDWLVDVAGHHVAGPRLMQDASSLIGLAIVAWIAWHSLRRGEGQPAAPRRIVAAERRHWLFAYGVTAIAVSVADLALIAPNEPSGASISLSAAHVAIASLRGLGVALLGVSLCLDWRLRDRA
jgi:hypothetical protein